MCQSRIGCEEDGREDTGEDAKRVKRMKRARGGVRGGEREEEDGSTVGGDGGH
jgi:hypothetical protein